MLVKIGSEQQFEDELNYLNEESPGTVIYRIVQYISKLGYAIERFDAHGPSMIKGDVLYYFTDMPFEQLQSLQNIQDLRVVKVRLATDYSKNVQYVVIETNCK